MSTTVSSTSVDSKAGRERPCWENHGDIMQHGHRRLMHLFLCHLMTDFRGRQQRATQPHRSGLVSVPHQVISAVVKCLFSTGPCSCTMKHACHQQISMKEVLRSQQPQLLSTQQQCFENHRRMLIA